MSQSLSSSDITVEYETLDSFTHLIVSIDKSKAVLHTNQVRTLLNCNINNLLQIKECDYLSAKIRYDVSSKVTLADVLSRRKIGRGEFSQLVLGIISAVEEIGGYGALTNAGLIYDTHFIFVSATSLTPEMMYLPFYKDATDLSVFRDFIRDLFKYSRIESTRDGFSDAVLDRINQEPFTLKDFKEAIIELEDFAPSIPIHQSREDIGIPASSIPGGLQAHEPVVEKNSIRFSGSGNKSEIPQTPAYEDQKGANSSIPPWMFPQHGSRDTYTEPTIDLPPLPVRAKWKDNKRAIRSVILFVVTNITLISLFAWLIYWHIGIENVLINLDYISVSITALSVAGIEFLAVKTLFFSNKAKKTHVNTSSVNPVKQEPPNAVAPCNNKPSRQLDIQPIPMPHALPKPMPQNTPQIQSITPQNGANAYERSNDLPHGWMNTGEKPTPGISVKSVGVAIPDTVVISNPNSTVGAHTEYPFFECVISGVLARIYINKEKFVIGRDPSVCDYVCRYDADDVGKVHAEITIRGKDLYIKDLNSKNNTYLTNEGDSGDTVFQLAPNVEYRLYHGAKIRLAGKTVFNVNIV